MRALNVAVQDVCATDLSDHLLISASPAAYAVAIDAIEHPGEPARLDRIEVPQPCVPTRMPGVEANEALAEELRIITNVPRRLMTGAVDEEPELRCYVTASCP